MRKLQRWYEYNRFEIVSSLLGMAIGTLFLLLIALIFQLGSHYGF